MPTLIEDLKMIQSSIKQVAKLYYKATTARTGTISSRLSP